MKTINKKLALWILATTVIFALWVTSVSAMWQWDLQWMGQGKWQWQWQNKSNLSGQEKNSAACIENIAKQDLSNIEIELLKKQYEEEMMANELYTSFYKMYGIETFKKIADSEAKHMEAVKVLLDRYKIAVPTDYNHIKDLYNQLKTDWSKSAFDALEVWVKIEFVDIDDIVKAIKSTDNDDIKVILTNIWWGSYNHLRGFLKAIDNNWYETDLDYTPYLSKNDLNTKWPIKYKLAEKLESEGVKLPKQVSSVEMKKQKGHSWDNENYNKIGNQKKWKNSDNLSRINTKKNSYIVILNKQYSEKINSFSNEQSESIIVKIDALLKTIMASDKSEVTKMNNIALLNALKEILQEKIDLIDIDSLLN